MKQKVEVTIDSNEAAQNPELTEILVIHEDVSDYLIEAMNEGDIKIGDCLFERKTPSDFASSLQEGRLREQVERLAARNKHAFILIEGDMSDFNNLHHSDIPSKSLRGMVASIIARNNIPVVFCSTPKTLADTAVRIARKTEEEATAVHTKTAETVKEPTFMENMFLGVEGIGMETAEKLAEHFTSIKPIYNAQPADFEAVEGIGPSLSKSLYDALHNDEKENESADESDSGNSDIVSI